MLRFLHTSDWQLGMTRHFLSAEAQGRFSQARCDAIRILGRIASEEACAFMVVAGDVFESNQVDRQTVSRALDALREVTVPVLLLPGNHDPLDAATVFRSTTFLARKPDNVILLEGAAPHAVLEGVEVVGAPWTSKRPLEDLVAAAVGGLEPPLPGVLRIAVGHGAIDALSPDEGDPARISLADAEAAIAGGLIHYLALGDRHSLTEVGTSRRIWYSGSPEPTDYVEDHSGMALVVDLDRESCSTREVATGTWRFQEWEGVALTSDADLDTVKARIEALRDKERTIVKLRLRGALPLRGDARLRGILSGGRDLLGALELREEEYAIVPEDGDFDSFGLTGFAKDTLDELRAAAEAGGSGAAEAREALALLVRLASTAP